jgi:hypothetical protein
MLRQGEVALAARSCRAAEGMELPPAGVDPQGQRGGFSVVDSVLGLARHRCTDQEACPSRASVTYPEVPFPAAAADEAGTNPAPASIPLTTWQNNKSREF